MTESFVLLKEGFSTADTDFPKIEFVSGDLLVKFNDWREQLVSLRFPDAVAFCWEEETVLPMDVRYDSSYKVIDSAWVAKLRTNDLLSEETHHYLLCFNTAGVLNVISGPIVVDP